MLSYSSFSSPIDEGVEDVLEDKLRDNRSLCTVASTLKFIDSNSSCSSPCPDNFTQSLNDLNIPEFSYASNIKESCIFVDPPKLILNDDGNYIYTSSPIRKCATTKLSNVSQAQKYRVSSFEDINAINHVKKQFRSSEEEQRIHAAFTPINSTEDVFNSSPVKHLTGKERSIMWKDSFLKCNKNNLTIKSNESIYEMLNKPFGKNNSNSEQEASNYEEYDDETSVENSSTSPTPEISSSQVSTRRGSEKLLFSLVKFKQNAIVESLAEDNSSKNNRLLNSSSSNDESSIDNTTITSTTNDECNSEEECSSLNDSLLKTPSIEDVRKFVQGFESEDASGNSEAVPLLGIEMQSMSSSTDAEYN